MTTLEWWIYIPLVIHISLLLVTSLHNPILPPWNLPHFSMGLSALRLSQWFATSLVVAYPFPHPMWIGIQLSSHLLFACSLVLIFTPHMIRPKIALSPTHVLIRISCVLLWSLFVGLIWQWYIDPETLFTFHSQGWLGLHTSLWVPSIMSLGWVIWQVHSQVQMANFYHDVTSLTLHVLTMVMLWCFCLQPQFVSPAFRLWLIWCTQTFVFAFFLLRGKWHQLFLFRHDIEEVEDYLQWGKGYDHFEAHCSQEFSVENIWCYYAITHYQTYHSPPLLNDICVRFIQDGAPAQINIDHTLREILLRCNTQSTMDLKQILPCLNAIKEELLCLMQESFYRFRSSSQYPLNLRHSEESTTMSSLRSSLFSLRASDSPQTIARCLQLSQHEDEENDDDHEEDMQEMGFVV